MNLFDKSEEYAGLCQRVKSCRLCKRMNDSQRVLNFSSGKINASVMFIGEAPGRLGADASGIPFHGDKAGDNFESLLAVANIHREDIFITNAVLCNPKDESGNNATPLNKEISNCSSFLKEQIDLVNPNIIVTLGIKSLLALSMIEKHNLVLKDAVRAKHEWCGRIVIPMYHPGQRAMMHRSFINQQSDYQFLREEISRFGVKAKKVYGTTNDFIVNIVRRILAVRKDTPTSYFAIHKLFYLIEWNYFNSYNQRLTNAYFIRQKDGPYCTDLHLTKLKKSIKELSISNRNGKQYLSVAVSKGDGKLYPSIIDNSENKEINDVVDNTVFKYLDVNDDKIKSDTYLTAPMRKLLRQEKKGFLMYNAPIIF